MVPVRAKVDVGAFHGLSILAGSEIGNDFSLRGILNDFLISFYFIIPAVNKQRLDILYRVITAGVTSGARRGQQIC